MNFKQTVKNIPPLRWVTYAVCAVMLFVMIGITVYRSVTDTLTENMAIMLGNIAAFGRTENGLYQGQKTAPCPFRGAGMHRGAYAVP